ncbi:MAG: filamentous hemagglutinin N-terminal domain-containing protein, partial [Chlorobiaceae bacterium]|nr:filamentous hemagglutinin N-terminal domain-containing protein [Chlorobiaceae bacterium]
MKKVNRAKKSTRSIRLSRRATSIAIATIAILWRTGTLSAATLPLAGELPAGEQLVSGQASVSRAGSAMSVLQTTDRAVLNWQSFNIGSQARVDFQQPGVQSVALNRVLSTDPSSIYGTLTSNGGVFLVNPSGIIFGKGSSVNVGSLVATTMSISDDDFNAGNYRFQRSGSTASIINQGSIRAAEGGLVALLGTDIKNDGVIEARLGSVILATGEAATLTLGSDNLYSVAVDPASVATLIDNKGIIQTDGGTVLMKASVAGELISSVINTSGVVRARSIGEKEGKIVLEGTTLVNSGTVEAGKSVSMSAAGALVDTGTITAGDGTNGGTITAKVNNLLAAGTWSVNGTQSGGTIKVDANGSIEQVRASGFNADGGTSGGSITINAGKSLYLSGSFSATGSAGRGGDIAITAPETLLAGAQVHADGKLQGGRIRIGGGWQGGDTGILNATTTVVTRPSTLTANATTAGNGGTVVVWSESSTAVAGTIAADGGPEGGNGGQVEISSHELLTWAGSISATAPHGTQGTVLFDPRNLTIDASGTSAPFTVIPLLDPHPAVGNQYGSGSVIELSGGNILVSNSSDSFVAPAAGAVRLYNPDGTLVSSLTGSTANDMVGYFLSALTGNGNALTYTPSWNNGGTAANAGAVTWINGTAGVSGAVSALNSLVGSTADDNVGMGSVTALSNGNYVVCSPNWNNGGTSANAGAVTWGSGLAGLIGAVSESNSLVGSTAEEQVGYGLTVLTNGNYVVYSPYWGGGGNYNDSLGAVTWGSGTVGVTGAVSALNSLVGSTAGDWVGFYGVTALTNGNYVVFSPYWNGGYPNGFGAATWGSGTAGVTGAVSAANSLVGSTAGDQVGYTMTELTNGNYVVCSPYWNGGDPNGYGAVTWGSGATGVSGVVSISNSLVGSTAGDRIGYSITPLMNGNYVVNSPNWGSAGNDADSVGAVTWGSGTAGVVGAVSATNSLVGSTAGDYVGINNVTALTNGNYVVCSSLWNGGDTNGYGAVTWGSGTAGVIGAVSAANSLVGSTAGDRVGINNVSALTNGNYLVNSPYWSNDGTTTNGLGAVTWGSGTAGVTGVVSDANSLVGSTVGDMVGYGVTVLTNGNYVVWSPYWNNGGTPNNALGAVTWGSGTSGVSGVVSISNSLVGSAAGDFVGVNGVNELTNGNYVVSSPFWNGGSGNGFGAVTWGSGTSGVTGAVSSSNSLVGSAAGDQVGVNNVIALNNGNYVVCTSSWNGGSGNGFGAVTWGSGTSGVTGVVSSSNSLVGSVAGDQVGSTSLVELTNGNYVVSSQYWHGGDINGLGAVTLGSGTSGVIGVVSAANSLVGSTAGDQVGYSVTPLINGDYVVSSPFWNGGYPNGFGAVTWGSGTAGVTGVVSSSNSFVGTTAGDSIGYGLITELKVGSMAGSFVLQSPSWSNSTGRIDILTPITPATPATLPQTYASNPGTDYTLLPSQLTALLNTGTNVVLQANNDIKVNSAIVTNNLAGNGGELSLMAGRSVLLNAGISTDNGNLTIIANDNTSNGVVDAYRLSGPAAITMATGTAINAGTGSVSMELRSGTGKTYSTSGDIILGAVTAGSISVVNHGSTAGSGITLNGELSASAGGTAIELAGMEFINNYGSAALLAPGGRWLAWSSDPANDTLGGQLYNFKQYNALYGSSTVLGTGNGFLYTLAPIITVSLTGSVSKTYDSFRSAAMLPGNYSFIGNVDSDTVILNNPSVGTYGDKNVGSNKSITVNGVSIVSASKGSVAVYGYQLASTSVTGNIGIITSALLPVTGLTASGRVYNAGTDVTLGGTATITKLGSDDITLGGTAVGTFVSKNVGTQNITVTGNTLSGADRDNYTLVQQTGLSAAITPYSLAVSGLTA